MSHVFLIVACVFGLCAFALGDDMVAKSTFQLNDVVPIQCMNTTSGQWGGAPICEETGKELQFKFGVDTFMYCGLHVDTDDDYSRTVKLIRQQENLNCRVPFSADKSFWVPFTIPFWGVVEPSHFHVDNHLNFIFHVEAGKIIGASVYPIRDRFQFGKIGSVINLHGPVRWFAQHSFTSLTNAVQHQSDDSTTVYLYVAFLMCMICVLATLVLVGLFYKFYLRPHLVRRFVKKD